MTFMTYGNKIFTKNLKGLIYVIRSFAEDSASALNKKGLIIGAYEGCNEGELKLTKTGTQYDEKVGGKLSHLLKGLYLKAGDARVFRNVGSNFYAIAIAALGREGVGYNDAENLEVCKENIRVAAGRAARYLQDDGCGAIFIEEFDSAEAACEAGVLATWKYEDLKSKESQAPRVKLDLFAGEDKDGWQNGKVKAEAQNFVRQLEETPSNLLNPSAFTQVSIDNLCPCGIQIEVRDRDWIKNKKMGAFLTVAQGSCENPLFLEVSYCGTALDDKPVAFIGMGVTFDTGGLCLKSANNMSEHRAALAGAAVVIGMFKAVAQLALPVNLTGLIPLCENMPSGMAMRPGDVVTAMNGQTIRIENTDNEGTVVLSDVLCYSEKFQPCLLIDIGTYTMGIRDSVGAGCSAVFSTSDVLWRELRRAGAETGDRVWRFPFWKYFNRQATDYRGVDINNVGKGEGGHTCLAAAFLKEFVPPLDFAHIDITGTGMSSLDDYFPYLRKHLMTGRPTRTLIQFLYQISCPHTKEE